MSLHIETFEVGPFPNNLYLLHDDQSREAVVIDPSIQSEEAIACVHELQKAGTNLIAIWNTHGHLDHVYDNARWKELFSVPVWMHEADLFLLEHLREQAIWLGLPPVRPVTPDNFFEPDQTIRVGRHHAKVLHTPGHSPGSVSLWFAEQNVVLSGDVLFQGSVGRTDLPGCDSDQLSASLRVLASLPASTQVLPGHGSKTTIAAEIHQNPFLSFLR